jgi:hypothetical protein
VPQFPEGWKPKPLVKLISKSYKKQPLIAKPIGSAMARILTVWG